MPRIIIKLLYLLAFNAAFNGAFISAAGQDVIEAFPNVSFHLGVDIQNAGDGSNRLFVAEQWGVIRVFPADPEIFATKVFLDLRDRVLSDSRFGLLGMAFHPDYASNGYFYLHYTAANPSRSVIARFQADSLDQDVADASSQQVLLEVGQPHNFHNGGSLTFGPDGYLYIALGDGGPGRDPNGHGQNRSTLLGNILRIDVDNPDDGLNYGIPADNPFSGNTEGYREEIWAWGLRNPWRISFDFATGRLWAGENGEDLYEEIDLIEAGKNYGWNVMEASQCFSPATGCSTTDLELPVWDYGGTSQRRSVIGGYVYHGRMNPELDGSYIYGDFLLGNIWRMDYDGENVTGNRLIASGQVGIATFGLDEAGEIYFSNISTGKLHRFSPTSTAADDRQATLDVQLLPNYPNPFEESTTFAFSLKNPGTVSLEVFDVLGRRVTTILDAHLNAGMHVYRWDGKKEGLPVPPGMYFYRLTSEHLSLSRPMVMLR